MDRFCAQRGFTLIEMSVVLVVIAIISAMGLSAGVDAIESTRRVATDQKLSVLEASLAAFRAKYQRLPCPANATLAVTDANYGLEAANMSGTCTGGTPAATYVTLGSPTGVPSGAVPVRTLNLPDEMMYDGWGRKFHYEVTPEMTADNAFLDSKPADNCSITAVDHAGGNLSILPVYALVSYGKNGIGAYLKGGTQYTQGTAGNAEQSNIRTVTNTPTVRLKNDTSGAMGTSGYYDDLVRIKSRYQLLDTNDRTTPLYTGPELVLAHDTTSGVQLVFGKRKCGAFQAFSGTIPSAVGAAPKFMAFGPGNTNLFVYHTNNCQLYSITNTTVAAVSAGTPVPNCPAAATVGAFAQRNGMLALSSTSAPYTRVYRQISSGASATYAELANAFFPALASAPEHLSLSANGEYLAVARHSASAYARLYVKKGDRYQDRGALPSDSYTEYNNAISPNGKYYAIAEVSGGNTRIYIWRNINGAFSQITSGGSALLYTVTGMTAPSILTFSPDSTYLAVGGTSSGHTLVALFVDPVAETVAAAATLTLSPAPAGVAFSADSRFMAVARGDDGSNSLSIYRRTGATSFAADTISSTFSFNGSANAVLVAMSR